MVYNGDTDPCINAFESQEWTESLGFKKTQDWRPWTTDNCQRMGGYVIRYENNFDFLTVKGSGHMVYNNNNNNNKYNIDITIKITRFHNSNQHSPSSLSLGFLKEKTTKLIILHVRTLHHHHHQI